MIRLLLLLVMIGLIGPHSSMAGKLYKWTDQDGKVHYSDHPAEGILPGKMTVKMAPKREWQLKLPDLDFTTIKRMFGAGHTWDSILPPSPMLPAACEKLIDDPDLVFSQRITTENCLPKVKVKLRYDKQRSAKMKSFHAWYDKYHR